MFHCVHDCFVLKYRVHEGCIDPRILSVHELPATEDAALRDVCRLFGGTIRPLEQTNIKRLIHYTFNRVEQINGVLLYMHERNAVLAQ